MLSIAGTQPVGIGVALRQLIGNIVNVNGFHSTVTPMSVNPLANGNGVLHHPISSPWGHFSLDDLKKIINEIDFKLICYPAGSIAASSNEQSSYSQFAWTRDMACIAFAMSEVGNIIDATRVAKCLAEFYNRKEERGRFTSFLFDPNAKEKFHNADTREHPQIRAWIDKASLGTMQESDQGWNHKQLDAIGEWLWLTFRLVNEGKLNLSELNDHLSTEINDENIVDSIFCVALRYLIKVHFWNQEDAACWEDFNKPNRASSMGTCLAALIEAKEYFENNNWNSINIYESDTFKQELIVSIENGRKSLRERIPDDGREAIETDDITDDSSLTFLLHPFNPGLSKAQEEAILKTIYKNQGEIGFTRRPHDIYVGMDYIYNSNGEGIYSDTSLSDYKAAQWTIFDPILSAYYYRKYINSGGRDVESFSLAENHLRRAQDQVTKQDEVFTKADGKTIFIPKGTIPEAYWFDTKEGRWRPNENSPLFWAEANFAIMFKEALIATSLFEKVSLS